MFMNLNQDNEFLLKFNTFFYETKITITHLIFIKQ